MKKKVLFASAAAVATLALANSVYAISPDAFTGNSNGYTEVKPETKGTVSVTVVDASTNKPVAGATLDFKVGDKFTSVTTGENGVATVSDVENGTSVVYRINVPAGYAEDAYQGHVYAVGGKDVPVTFTITPATVENNRDTLRKDNPAPTSGDGSEEQAKNNKEAEDKKDDSKKDDVTPAKDKDGNEQTSDKVMNEAKKADEAAKTVSAKSGAKTLPNTSAK